MQCRCKFLTIQVECFKDGNTAAYLHAWVVQCTESAWDLVVQGLDSVPAKKLKAHIGLLEKTLARVRDEIEISGFDDEDEVTLNEWAEKTVRGIFFLPFWHLRS